MQVSDICTRALALAGWTGQGAAPSAEDMNDAVQTLNLMLFSWALDGMDVGHTSEVVSTNDLYIDDAYLKAVIYALAVELAALNGTEIDPKAVQIAINETNKVRASLMDVDIMRGDSALVNLCNPVRVV